MLEMFIFETVQLLEQLEDILIESEKTGCLTTPAINEVFRIMHTIKGAAAMMMYDSIARLTHAAEDLFSSIRAASKPLVDCVRLTDIVLRVSDFIKAEVARIEDGQAPGANPDTLITQISRFLETISNPTDPEPAKPMPSADPEPEKPVPAEHGLADLSGENPDLRSYTARIFFEEGCQMENMRAFTVVYNLKSHVQHMSYQPADIADNEQSSDIIRQTGFHIHFTSDESQEMLYACLDQTLFLDRLEFEIVDSRADEPAETALLSQADIDPQNVDPIDDPALPAAAQPMVRQQSIISVNTTKLDQLMDLVGELVIAEAMVTKNPELQDKQLDNFHKAARQLGKLTSELQDVAMSIRMIPVAATFHKMQRIVRDMTRKLGKDVELVVSGEETEVDKTIIDSLSDPLMHLIRNALDHGIESPAERKKAGKPVKGSIFLEARNSGGDVWITIRDDGRGLDKQKILNKAEKLGLLSKPAADHSDKEIFGFIMLAGFSTKDQVSEYSGRGVGMDVVRENILKINGTINLDSVYGKGTTITIRIPLTLAIINGMLVTVGDTRFIIPTTTIRETFRAEARQVLRDPDGYEMMMIRGQCHSLSRLHRRFRITPRTDDILSSIIVVVEDDERVLCLLADELIGEHQVVVKPLPSYIKKVPGLAGCTILGDGCISLILDISSLVSTH